MRPPRRPSLRLVRKFFLLTKAFFKGGRKGQARGWLAALMALGCAVGVVQVFISYSMRDFVTALAQRDHEGWVRNLLRFVALCFVSVPVGVFYRYSQERLSLVWRRWMTQHLIKRYFFNRAYYRIRTSESVDNPDQRISEDARLFTTGVLSYVLVLVNSIVTLVAFIGVLWTVSVQLVAVLFVYATVGTLVAMLFGKRLVGLHFNQYQREANFRYG